MKVQKNKRKLPKVEMMMILRLPDHDESQIQKIGTGFQRIDRILKRAKKIDFTFLKFWMVITSEQALIIILGFL